LSRKSKTTLHEQPLSPSLDLGVIDFMKWLSYIEYNKDSPDTPFIIKEIVQDKYIIFYDKELLKDVIVIFKNGIPWCINCEADDCGHVGFAVCLKQYCIRNGSIDICLKKY
jgi:hypothetical protein